MRRKSGLVLAYRDCEFARPLIEGLIDGIGLTILTADRFPKTC